MEEQEKILKAIIESDSAFRAQFDRDSTNFHNGDPTPVPIGGQKIPESMKGEPQTVPEEQKTIEDPRYTKILNARSYLQEYKKLLTSVCPAVESRLRAKSIKDDEKKNKAVQEADENIEKVLVEVRVGKSKLAEFSDVLNDFTEDIQYVLDNAALDYQNKEEYGEFMLRLGRFNKKLFKEVQDLLQSLKKIKSGKA